MFACAACGAGPLVAMPKIALPPPLASVTASAPVEPLLAKNERATMGDVYDALADRLTRAGYADWALYALSDDGFAVVTRIEAIGESGAPRPTRFGPRRVPYRSRGFALDDVRQVLFNEPPGRYRVLVLGVTAHPLTSDADKPALAHMDPDDLASGKLPDDVRKRPAHGARIEALVYELERPDDASAPAALVARASAPAKEQLTSAGIFGKAELP